MRQPQVSKHLKVLAAASLVSARAEGRHRHYRLDGRGLRLAHDWFASFEDVWNARFEALDELVSTNTERDVEMDWALEVIVVPVSDLDRSKAFYCDQLGFHLDHDSDFGEGRRVIQLTPPGSRCSIVFGAGGVVAEMPPGAVKGLQLVVSDIERAHRILTQHGVETSGVQVLGENPRPTEHPLDNVGFIFLEDPDGNGWAIQQISTRGSSDP